MDGVFARRFNGVAPGSLFTFLDATEFLVNQTITGVQAAPSVALHNPPTQSPPIPQRGFVVSWEGPEGAGLGTAIFARGYTSAATPTPRGNEVIVHSVPRANNQLGSSIAIDGFGQGMVTYSSFQSGALPAATDTSSYGVYAQRYSKLNIAPVATDLVVNIDEDSFDELDMAWPFPRALHGTLLEMIGAGEPLAIGVDLLFPEPSVRGREDDRELGDSITRVKKRPMVR